jgi:hypothetical protein
MSEAIQFLCAVVSHWATLVTGGVVMAAIYFWEKWKGKSINKKLIMSVFVVFLFWAFFLAWKEEHAGRQMAEQNSNIFSNNASAAQVRINKLSDALQIANSTTKSPTIGIASSNIVGSALIQGNVSNATAVGTMNLGDGSVGINNGTVNTTSDPALKNAYKVLPDGRIAMLGTVSGEPINILREVNAADQAISNHNFFEATTHLTNAIYLFDASRAIPLQGNNVLIQSDTSREYLANIARVGSLTAMNSQQFEVAARLADRFLAEGSVKYFRMEDPKLQSHRQSEAYYFKAVALFNLGRTDAAQEALNKSIEAEPTNTNSVQLKSSLPR